jgi:DNA-binding XRE family transcriptional regulator
MSETEVITKAHWRDYARRVERETTKRYGCSLTVSRISQAAGHMIVTGGPGEHLTVRPGWSRVMRTAARGGATPAPPAAPPHCPGPIPGVGARVQAARTRQGFSLARLARQIGIDPLNLRKIEDGRTADPRLSTAWRLAQALQLTMDALCGLTDAPAATAPETCHDVLGKGEQDEAASAR